MANDSLSDRACTINLPVAQSTLNDLARTIAKVSALIQVSLCSDFSDCQAQTQHDYLWVLSDFINQAE